MRETDGSGELPEITAYLRRLSCYIQGEGDIIRSNDHSSRAVSWSDLLLDRKASLPMLSPRYPELWRVRHRERLGGDGGKEAVSGEFHVESWRVCTRDSSVINAFVPSYRGLS